MLKAFSGEEWAKIAVEKASSTPKQYLWVVLNKPF